MIKLRSLLVLAGILMLSSTTFAASFSVGVLAKRGSEGFFERWLLHGGYLSEQTGHDISFVPLKFDEVEPAVAAGRVDFVLVNSSMFVDLQEKHGVVPIATMINRTQLGTKTNRFGGVIFTSAQSGGINALSDVRGKPFIAVKKSSFGGYQMAVKEMQDNGFNITRMDETTEFTDSHDEVVKRVLARPGSVGTVRTNILERMAFEGTINMSDVKVLNQKQVDDFPFVLSTKLYPEWPMGRLAKTDPQVAQQVANALISMPGEGSVSRLASVGGWTAPLDYGEVKELLIALGIIKGVSALPSYSSGTGAAKY
jgi:twitching motility protein PilJ